MLLTLLWCLALPLANAQVAGLGASPLVLRDVDGSVNAAPSARVWLDTRGDAGIAQVTSRSGLSLLQPAGPRLALPAGSSGALWLHLRLTRGINERQDWLLDFPMPSLDHVTVYQQEGTGWRAETAGDTLPVAQWPEPGRHPAFRLDLPHGQMRDVFVRVRHATPANIPLRLSSTAVHAQRIQVEYLGLGSTFGALVLLIAACLAQAWLYRDRIYLWYSAYAAIATLTVAAYTGLAAHLLWPAFGLLGDAPQPMLALAASAAAVLFVRSLVGFAARHPHLDQAVRLMGWAGLLLALLPAVLPKLLAYGLAGAYAILAMGVNCLIALTAVRRGDVAARWVLGAYAPLAITVGVGVGRLFGWLPATTYTQYGLMVALTLQVPLLLVALSLRSRERHSALIREQALSTQDALTGLLAPHLFHDRLRQVVARHRRDRESAAVVFIDLVNHARIKELFGAAVAEQSLLRSVIKLRRLVRDVDTVSRVGEARFGIILEGVRSRVVVTDRAARLIAAGLMPLEGLKPDVTLQFHIGAVLLDECPLEATEIPGALDALLAGMSPRTRRPIRFVAAQDTHPAAMPDSSLLADAAEPDPKRPPLTAVK